MSKSELKCLCAQNPVEMAERIVELELRLNVLTDMLNSIDNASTECEGDDGELVFSVDADTIHAMRDVIEQTPQQTAEQIERWHVEWMRSLPTVAVGCSDMAKDGRTPPVAWINSYPKDGEKLVAIPQLPETKEPSK